MTGYFLGVDTGGTKSHALVADEQGHALSLSEAGPGNHEIVGYDGLVRTLQTITNEALMKASISKSQLSGAGFGIAGYDWPSEREDTRQALETLGLSAPYEFVNDTVIGLLAGAKNGWGVAVVGGTGCNCWGWDQHGREGRVTGMGSDMAEYGGGGELVGAAIRAISLAWSRRGPETQLTQALIDHIGATDVVDLLEGVTQGRYRFRAKDAPLVFEIAAQGDPVAVELMRWAGRELGGLAVGVIRQLTLEALDFEVVLVGSFYKGSPLIMETMTETIHAVAPQARLVYLNAPPVVGAVVLGMQQAGVNPSPVRETLIESTQRLWSIQHQGQQVL